MSKNHLIPIPEAVRDGGKFTVINGSPYTDLKNRRMSAPFDFSSKSRSLQQIELAKAKWSPESLEQPDIDSMFVEAAESARLNKLLDHVFLPPDVQTISKSVIDFTTETGDLSANVALFATCFGNKKNTAAVKRGIKGNKLLQDIFHSVTRRVDRYFGYVFTAEGSFTYRTVPLARELQNFADSLERGKENLENSKSGDPVEGDITDEEIMESLVEMRYCGEADRWKPILEIEEPPRTIAQKLDLKARKKVKQETGSVPVAIHRQTIDQRVFLGYRRRPGAGSVLIDMSGSMSLSSRDIERIMDALPGVVIAGYTASGAHTHGMLRIFAKNGRRVETHDFQMDGGQNACDGPALNWLERQPKPRFWVCDGFVTGVVSGTSMTSEDEPTEELLQEVRDIQTRSRILRVPSASELALRVAKMKAKA
jgi:hypothetical protein